MSQEPAQVTTQSTCPSCGIPMEAVMDVPFRIGGSGGGMHLLFGNWAELGEQLLSLDMYICQKCGRVQFYADEKTKKSLRLD